MGAFRVGGVPAGAGIPEAAGIALRTGLYYANGAFSPCLDRGGDGRDAGRAGPRPPLHGARRQRAAIEQADAIARSAAGDRAVAVHRVHVAVPAVVFWVT